MIFSEPMQDPIQIQETTNSKLDTKKRNLQSAHHSSTTEYQRQKGYLKQSKKKDYLQTGNH